jgi:hypothetical protein
MLLTQIDQLQQYVVVGKDLSYKSFQPALFNAEQKYIIPFLGRTLYDFILENDYHDDYQTLLNLARNATAKFALWLYITPGGVQIDDQGIYQAKNENMWRLSPTDLLELKKSYLEEAMDAQNQLLAYLEETVQTPDQQTDPEDYTAFELWAVSQSRKRYAGLMINTAEVFGRYVELYHSTLTFITLYNCIQSVEKNAIAPLMGDYYATLKAIATPTGDALAMLTLAQEAIAYLATAKGLRKGMYCLREDRLGLTLTPAAMPSDDIIATYQAEGQNALERLRAKLELLKPTGYTPLPILETDATVLRRTGSKIILA